MSALKLGSPSVFSQWSTVMLSCVNSPVQISTPIPIRTSPAEPDHDPVVALDDGERRRRLAEGEPRDQERQARPMQ